MALLELADLVVFVLELAVVVLVVLVVLGLCREKLLAENMIKGY